jgi:hypothetical protein
MNTKENTRTCALFAAAMMAGLVVDSSRVRAAELLAVDFGTASSPVESGFVGQSAASATHTTTAGDITVAISDRQGNFDYAPPNTTGSNVDFYRDFFFKNGAVGGGTTGTMILTLSGPGISASTDYVLSFWTQYQAQARPTVFTPTSGSTGTALGPISTTNAAATGLADPNHFISGTFTSDGSGVLTIAITATDNRPAINGVRIETVASEADPRITSITSVGGGVWELALKGDASTTYEFRSSTTLEFAPGTQVVSLMAGVPAVGAISGTNNEIVTTDGSGDATVRMTLTGNPADFVRAQSVP